MDSLIDSIQSLEKQANEVVEKARLRVRELDAEADKRIQANHDEVMAAIAQRVAVAKSEAEKKFQQDLAAAQQAAQDEFKAVDQIPGDAIRKQAARIVERFRTL